MRELFKEKKKGAALRNLLAGIFRVSRLILRKNIQNSIYLDWFYAQKRKRKKKLVTYFLAFNNKMNVIFQGLIQLFLKELYEKHESGIKC